MKLNRSPLPRGGYKPHVPRKVRHLPWLPQILRTALGNHLRVLLGLSLFTGSLLCLALLVSYAPQDQSWNSISNLTAAPHNLLGYAGSYSADLLHQFFGHASYLCCVVLAGWGWRIMSDRGLDHLKGRIAMSLAALLLTGTALQALLPGSTNGYAPGGAFGVLLADKLLRLAPQDSAHAIVAGLSGFMALLTLYMACALTLSEWTRVLQFAHTQVRRAVQAVLGVVTWLWRRLAHHPVEILRDDSPLVPANDDDAIVMPDDDIPALRQPARE